MKQKKEIEEEKDEEVEKCEVCEGKGVVECPACGSMSN